MLPTVDDGQRTPALRWGDPRTMALFNFAGLRVRDFTALPANGFVWDVRGESPGLPNGMYIQSGTLSVRARSELGTSFLVHSQGHDVDGFDGTTKMCNHHGAVSGCLP